MMPSTVAVHTNGWGLLFQQARKKWAWNTNAVRSPWLTLKKLILYVVHWQHVAKNQKCAGFLKCGSNSFHDQPLPGWVLQRRLHEPAVFNCHF
jgi:hypothetical protein